MRMRKAQPRAATVCAATIGPWVANSIACAACPCATSPLSAIWPIGWPSSISTGSAARGRTAAVSAPNAAVASTSSISPEEPG
ncbi:hypothetical protein [Nocardia seriolae]|uniref:hypothetical protein n=1 Tax=Nocardia seriolae TaxID=37332 RepID=UPI00055FC43A|nr:hypothetical protein [Nocardia seriolae]